MSKKSTSASHTDNWWQSLGRSLGLIPPRLSPQWQPYTHSDGLITFDSPLPVEIVPCDALLNPDVRHEDIHSCEAVSASDPQGFFLHSYYVQFDGDFYYDLPTELHYFTEHYQNIHGGEFPLIRSLIFEKGGTALQLLSGQFSHQGKKMGLRALFFSEPGRFWRFYILYPVKFTQAENLATETINSVRFQRSRPYIPLDNLLDLNWASITLPDQILRFDSPLLPEVQVHPENLSGIEQSDLLSTPGIFNFRLRAAYLNYTDQAADFDAAWHQVRQEYLHEWKAPAHSLRERELNRWPVTDRLLEGSFQLNGEPWQGKTLVYARANKAWVLHVMYADSNEAGAAAFERIVDSIYFDDSRLETDIDQWLDRLSAKGITPV